MAWIVEVATGNWGQWWRPIDGGVWDTREYAESRLKTAVKQGFSRDNLRIRNTESEANTASRERAQASAQWQAAHEKTQREEAARKVQKQLSTTDEVAERMRGLELNPRHRNPSAKAAAAILQAVEAYSTTGPGSAGGAPSTALLLRRERWVSEIYDAIDQQIGAYRRPEGSDIDLLKWTRLDMPFAQTREQLQAALAITAFQNEVPGHSFSATGTEFAYWVMRGEDALRRYDALYADVPRAIATQDRIKPWRVGRDLESALRGFTSVQNDVDAINEALRGHRASAAAKLNVWNNLTEYIRTLTPAQERAASAKARAAELKKFEAAERRRLAAEARKEAKLGRKSGESISQSLEESSRRRAAAIRLGPVGVGPGFKKALVEGATQRGMDILRDYSSPIANWQPGMGPPEDDESEKAFWKARSDRARQTAQDEIAARARQIEINPRRRNMQTAQQRDAFLRRAHMFVQAEIKDLKYSYKRCKAMGGSCDLLFRAISCPWIESEQHVLECLHEIGHARTVPQLYKSVTFTSVKSDTRALLWMERDAWVWALQAWKKLGGPLPDGQLPYRQAEFVRYAFGTYLHQSKEDDEWARDHLPTLREDVDVLSQFVDLEPLFVAMKAPPRKVQKQLSVEDEVAERMRGLELNPGRNPSEEVQEKIRREVDAGKADGERGRGVESTIAAIYDAIDRRINKENAPQTFYKFKDPILDMALTAHNMMPIPSRRNAGAVAFSADRFWSMILRGERIFRELKSLMGPESYLEQYVEPWQIGWVAITSERSAAWWATEIRSALRQSNTSMRWFFDGFVANMDEYLRLRSATGGPAQAQKAREKEAEKFAAAERRRLAAEARKEAKLGRKSLPALEETLEQSAQRRAASIQAGPTGLKPGYRKGQIEAGKARGASLELGAPTHEVVPAGPEARAGIEASDTRSATPETDIQQGFHNLGRLFNSIHGISGRDADHRLIEKLNWAKDSWQDGLRSGTSKGAHRAVADLIFLVYLVKKRIQAVTDHYWREELAPKYESALVLLRALEHTIRASYELADEDTYERGIVERASTIETDLPASKLGKKAREHMQAIDAQDRANREQEAIAQRASLIEINPGKKRWVFP